MLHQTNDQYTLIYLSNRLPMGIKSMRTGIKRGMPIVTLQIRWDYCTLLFGWRSSLKVMKPK